jgi:RNA polymerase sigma-70 factor (ECF subfamily)
MENSLGQQHLSDISTLWAALRQAGEGPSDTAAEARHLLLQRYGGAVQRYLHGAVQDPHAADEVFQEFALALLRGEFGKAAPERGRFRDYIKTALFHLVSKHYDRQRRQPRALAADSPALADLPAREDAEGRFQESWKAELLARTWQALADAQPVLHAVLRLRTDQPKLPSPEAAAMLAQKLGKRFTPESMRQALHRARVKYVDLLLDEVAHSLAAPTRKQMEQELQELSLLEHCRAGLDRAWPAQQ